MLGTRSMICGMSVLLQYHVAFYHVNFYIITSVGLYCYKSAFLECIPLERFYTDRWSGESVFLIIILAVIAQDSTGSLEAGIETPIPCEQYIQSTSRVSWPGSECISIKKGKVLSKGIPLPRSGRKCLSVINHMARLSFQDKKVSNPLYTISQPLPLNYHPGNGYSFYSEVADNRGLHDPQEVFICEPIAAGSHRNWI